MSGKATKKNEVFSFLRYMLHRPGYAFGLAVVVVSIVLIFFGAALAPYPPETAFSGFGSTCSGRTRWGWTSSPGSWPGRKLT